ncbi:D-alanine-D-alanine ligase [Cutibacterium acnes JCM 18920]|nr:D-alanine-D-alanine ligase [Cutibacterium acnes JCM 18920]
MNRIHVAVIFGGMSSEHSISCLSAANVVAAIDAERFDVSGVGISPQGIWVRYGADEILALPGTGQLPTVEMGDRPLVSVKQMPEGTCIVDTEGNVDAVQVVFPVLHGPFGEDGTIQGLLEMAGVRYVGCGVAASANCMDKHLTKMILSEAGVLVGPYVVVRDHEWREDRNAVLKAASRLEYPLFVKPARGGSSIGISRVTSQNTWKLRLRWPASTTAKSSLSRGFVVARSSALSLMAVMVLPLGPPCPVRLSFMTLTASMTSKLNTSVESRKHPFRLMQIWTM